MNRLAELFRGKNAMTGLPHLHDKEPNFTPPSLKIPARELQLDIVVGSRCPICKQSQSMVDTLRRELPNVTLRVIDMDAPDTKKPANVIAIPSFLLNGHLVATGYVEIGELKKFIQSLN